MGMITVASIVGARPQIVKAAAFSRAVRGKFIGKINEIIIHSGQHYDHDLSEVFFEELQIPAPHYNLHVGSASHATQTARMLEKFETVFADIHPDAVIVYGDTNSTLAAALAAVKIHIPVIHIEAGLRSFNKTMPEEINRICTDHCATLLFSPTQTGISNLVKEGFHTPSKKPYSIDNPGLFHCGDIMLDNSIFFAKIAEKKSTILQQYALKENQYVLATLHRDFNTDNTQRLENLLAAFIEIAQQMKMVIPLHPRTEKQIAKLPSQIKKSFITHPDIQITPPLSYFDMLKLEKHCRLVITDSGGVQKEAYFFRKPVIIIRPETEWTEIVENQCGIITNSINESILKAFSHFIAIKNLGFPPLFGDGKAAETICQVILEHFETNPITNNNPFTK
jgi:UDP-GlcNAc3NAcA epimerase